RGLRAIGLDDFAAPAQFENRVPRSGRFGIHISSNNRNVRAFACQRNGGGGSDSTSSSRDEGNFSGKFHMCAPCLRVTTMLRQLMFDGIAEVSRSAAVPAASSGAVPAPEHCVSLRFAYREMSGCFSTGN